MQSHFILQFRFYWGSWQNLISETSVIQIRFKMTNLSFFQIENYHFPHKSSPLCYCKCFSKYLCCVDQPGITKSVDSFENCWVLYPISLATKCSQLCSYSPKTRTCQELWNFLNFKFCNTRPLVFIALNFIGWSLKLQADL